MPEPYKATDRGYQSWAGLVQGVYPNGLILNSDYELVKEISDGFTDEDMYLYTQHQIEHVEGELRQTRSSPNFEGGVVTFSTCKHNMRTWKKPWGKMWLGGLCPAECADNTLLFFGKIDKVFKSNALLRIYIRENFPAAFKAKDAMKNPRGDLYKRRAGTINYNDHNNFVEPPNHTRSTEFYKKSPGSVSEREDGKIPKWWRDIEYIQRGRRPPSFILSPCFVFSTPTAWTTFTPRRACLLMTVGEFIESLSF